MNYRFFLLSLTILLVVSGCSNKVPLGGTVTFSDDGAPLTQGAVFFQSETLQAQGGIKPDGTYIVGTDKLTDGIPKGTYRVMLVGTEQIAFKANMVKDPSGKNIERKQETRTPVIDTKYGNVETSGLSFVVDGKKRKFDFQVDRYKK